MAANKLRLDDFMKYLKKSPLAVTLALISLLALLLGVIYKIIDRPRVALVVICVLGSVLLFTYNIWIIDARKTPRSKKRLFPKKLRISIHAISACLFVICLIIVACIAWPKHSGYVLYKIGRHNLARKQLESYLVNSPEDYCAQYKLALCYEKLDKQQECIKKLETLKKGDHDRPDDPNEYLLASPVAYDVYYQLAQCYKNLPDPNNYIKTLDCLLEQKSIFKKFGQSTANEKKFEIHIEIALVLVSLDYIEGISNQYEKAQIHIENARGLDPNSPVILWIQGFLIAYEAGDGDSDIKEKVEVLFRDSKLAIERIQLPEESYKYRSWFSQHHYWFGRALSDLGEYGLAKEEFNAGLNITLKERRLLNSLQDFYFRLGQNEYRSTGEIDSADYYWQNISEKDYLARRLLSVGVSYLHRAEATGKKGDLKKQKKHLDDAYQAFSQAKQRGLESEALFFRLGQLYFERGEYLYSSNNFEQATQKNPLNYLGFYWLGRSRFCQDKFSQAKEAINRAKELDAKDAYVRYWLGRILYKEGDIGGALKEFEKSIEFDNKNSGAHKWRILCLYTNSEKIKERYSNERVTLLKEALTYTKQGIEALHPEKDESALKAILGLRHVILNNLAYIYAERGENLTLAEAYVCEALEIAESQRHKSLTYLDTKAWVIIRKTEKETDLTEEQKRLNYKKAEELLHKSLRVLKESLQALSLDESNPKITKIKANILYHLGYLEKLRGNKSKAEEYIFKCLAINPEHPGAEKLLD